MAGRKRRRFPAQTGRKPELVRVVLRLVILNEHEFHRFVDLPFYPQPGDTLYIDTDHPDEGGPDVLEVLCRNYDIDTHRMEVDVADALTFITDGIRNKIYTTDYRDSWVDRGWIKGDVPGA